MWYSKYCANYFDLLSECKKKTISHHEKTKKIIDLTIKTLQKLKSLVLENGFTTKEEEILFFKLLKPRIFSQLIYYKKVKEIEETLSCIGFIKEREKYLSNELHILGLFYQKNRDFCDYMHNDQSYLDDKYFVRNTSPSHIFDDSFLSILDNEFSTSYDYKAASLLAFDSLKIYLNNKIENIYKKENTSHNIDASLPKLKWTGSKIALIELIYALQASGYIDNGQAGISDLKTEFENMFDIELGDCYRHFSEIKIRHQATKFIDYLAKCLNDKVNS